VLARIEKSKIMWNYFFRVCILNRTSVYLRLFDYVSGHMYRVLQIHH